jgi:abequosyltransferase
MYKKQIKISICIPAYNRPEKLRRLLESIDCSPRHHVEIVVCEDNSPRRNEIRNVVRGFVDDSGLEVSYIENCNNLGYDGNIRKLIEVSTGDFVIFMGDDDMFVPRELDLYIEYLNNNKNVGYVLRSYRNIDNKGGEERFIYYPEIVSFEPGERAYIELYRKSVFISGFTFRRTLALGTLTNRFDGTLLYQLYVLAEICLKYPSAAYNRPLTQGIIEEKDFYFGVSDAEKKYRVPGKITIKGELRFINSFIMIAEFLDNKYGLKSKEKILLDMSKYSYPMISSIRNQGLKNFVDYVIGLYKIGLGKTVYFYIYVVGLMVLGDENCKRIIRFIKRRLGKTPAL